MSSIKYNKAKLLEACVSGDIEEYKSRKLLCIDYINDRRYVKYAIRHGNTELAEYILSIIPNWSYNLIFNESPMYMFFDRCNNEKIISFIKGISQSTPNLLNIKANFINSFITHVWVQNHTIGVIFCLNEMDINKRNRCIKTFLLTKNSTSNSSNRKSLMSDILIYQRGEIINEILS